MSCVRFIQPVAIIIIRTVSSKKYVYRCTYSMMLYLYVVWYSFTLELFVSRQIAVDEPSLAGGGGEKAGRRAAPTWTPPLARGLAVKSSGGPR